MRIERRRRKRGGARDPEITRLNRLFSRSPMKELSRKNLQQHSRWTVTEIYRLSPLLLKILPAPFLHCASTTLYLNVCPSVKNGFNFFCSFDRPISRVVVVFRFSFASRDTSHRLSLSLSRATFCRRELYSLVFLD